jgi:SAM-dependent MidA family methyltransferase
MGIRVRATNSKLNSEKASGGEEDEEFRKSVGAVDRLVDMYGMGKAYKVMGVSSGGGGRVYPF